ncbi:hypothetical protein CI610_01128 [invertebrate metagenome]|uniref:O-antigen ligase-related domain-containing protein n=1 Tax=invertebrate metagenome TaxID=1711999 RepID=A0A2H9T9N3_9ZZZZ
MPIETQSLSNGQNGSRIYQNILFISVSALLIWLPLPSGSNSVWASAWFCFWVFCCGAAAVIGVGYRKLSVTPVFVKVRWFHGLFLACLLLIGLQCVDLPEGWVQVLSPKAWALHHQAAEVLNIPVTWMPLSLDVEASRRTFLLSVAYYGLFCLLLLLVNSPKKLEQLAWILIISGTFQAVFGVLSTLSGAEVLLFSEKTSYFGVATGTFVNRNSFAGYLEMTLAVGVGLLVSRLSQQRLAGWKQRLQQIITVLMSSKVLLRGALVMMVIALVVSRSRMGNTAFFSSLLITGFLYVVLRKKWNRSLLFLLGSMLVIDMAIVSQWFGIEKVMERLEQTSMERESRPDVAHVITEMIQDFPLTGTGGGTFYTALPMYHNGSWQGFYDLAHNDFLQFALEFGLPAFLCFAGMVLFAVVLSVQSIRYRKKNVMAGIGFASLMGILAIMMHSLVDFNLQIPANAATFVCLMALACLARYGFSDNRR